VRFKNSDSPIGFFDDEGNRQPFPLEIVIGQAALESVRVKEQSCHVEQGRALQRDGRNASSAADGNGLLVFDSVAELRVLLFTQLE
jgi:hypothetical protein